MVPEHQGKGEASDPFVDIWCLGHFVDEDFLERYENLDFLRLLIWEMTREDPGARPKIEEVRSRFGALMEGEAPEGMGMIRPRDPLVLRGGVSESYHESLSRFDRLVRRMRRFYCRVLGKPAIPTPKTPRG
jgi:hypothetical protein